MSRRERELSVASPVSGRARIDTRTKDLIKRLEPGDIAIIDHVDLDRVAADGLVEAGVVAVINAAHSISGRYPNDGPLRLVGAGIPLLDHVDRVGLGRVQEGDRITIADDEIRRGPEPVAVGTRLSVDDVRAVMADARRAIGTELERFATNTLEYIQVEAEATFAPLALPELSTRFDGRHALVVVRGHDYREDLRALRPYISEYRPLLIGVDGGADALLEIRRRPDVIIGDFDSLSAAALGCGAELVHHVHPDGRAPGRDELAAAGASYQEFVVEGTSEDAAMLLAHEAGARLIVAVGTHASMVEFLDKGRPGMASTFLTRLRLGPQLVDAKGVNQLYQGRVRRRDIAALVIAACVVVIVMAVVSDSLRVFFDAFWLTIRDLWFSITDAL